MEEHEALMSVVIDRNFSLMEHVRSVKSMTERKTMGEIAMLIHVMKGRSCVPTELARPAQILREDKKVKLLYRLSVKKAEQ